MAAGFLDPPAGLAHPQHGAQHIHTGTGGSVLHSYDWWPDAGWEVHSAAHPGGEWLDPGHQVCQPAWPGGVCVPGDQWGSVSPQWSLFNFPLNKAQAESWET